MAYLTSLSAANITYRLAAESPVEVVPKGYGRKWFSSDSKYYKSKLGLGVRDQRVNRSLFSKTFLSAFTIAW